MATHSVSLPVPARRVYQYLVHGSLFLGLVTVAKLATVGLLLGVTPTVSLGVGLLIPVGVYNLNNLADADEDAVNAADRARFVARGGRLYALGSALSLVTGVALAALGGLVALGVAFVPAGAAGAYSLPWLPGPGPDRLKDVPVVSTSLVSAAWAVPLTYLPLAFAGGPVAGAGHVVAFFFLRTFIAAQVRNVRDVDGDRQAGVWTLPVVLSPRSTRALCYLLDGLSLAVLVHGAAVGALPAVAPLALAPAVALSLAITARATPDADLRPLCLLRDLEYPLMALGVGAALLVQSP